MSFIVSFGASDVHLCAQANYVDLYMGEQNIGHSGTASTIVFGSSYDRRSAKRDAFPNPNL